MKAPPRSAWLAAIWVGLLAMLGLALWGWWFGQGGPAQAGSAGRPPPPAVVARASAASGAPRAGPSDVLTAVALAPLAAVPAAEAGSPPVPPSAPQVAVARPAAVKQVGRWQLCLSEGQAQRPAAAASVSPIDIVSGQRLQSQLDKELAQAWPELLAHLATDRAPRRQAAAMVLSAWPMFGPSRPASGPLTPPAPTSAARSRLVDLSLSQADPVVRHWAKHACVGQAAEGACSRFTARHWARLDAGNFWPWLHLLAEEPEARDEALSGMAGAVRLDSAWGQLALAVDQAWPARLPAYLRLQALTSTSALETALWSPPLNALVLACPAGDRLDLNRRQQCQAIGRLLVGQASELLTYRIGRAVLARATGQAEAPANASVDELAFGVETLPGMAEQQPFGCAAVAGWRARTQGVAALGELGWLRQLRARAPRPSASATGG